MTKDFTDVLYLEHPRGDVLYLERTRGCTIELALIQLQFIQVTIFIMDSSSAVLAKTTLYSLSSEGFKIRARPAKRDSTYRPVK